MELRSTGSIHNVGFESTLTLDRVRKEPGEKNYNPFAHRNVPHPNSTVGSFFHLLKSSLGSGLLAMPVAFKHAGVAAGVIGTIVVGAIATHCVHILVRTSHEICQEIQVPLLSYADTCENVFKYGPRKLRRFSSFVSKFTDSAMAAVCLGGTSVYVSFIATALKDMMDYYVPGQKLTVVVYCAIILVPLILITQIRYLKYLVPFSIFANGCLMVTMGITLYYTFSDLPPVTERDLVVSVREWPLFVSTAIFSMEGINVVMPVENEMRHPERFLGCPGILNITMILVCALYAVVGFFGYLKYGPEILGSITLNLPQQDVISQIAKFLVAISVFFTYCLQMYAPMDIIWTRIKSKITNKYENISQIAIRTIGVTFTVALAAAIPDLELLIGLVGTIFFSTLGLFIPVVVETVHRWHRDLGTFNWILWKNLFLILFYGVVLVSGCYSTISEIVKRLQA